MCVIDFDEYCTVWQENTRKARKAHKCSCCRRQIEPGETYLTHFSIFDGNCNSEKCCSDCEKDREEFAAAHGGVLTNPGSFVQTLWDCMSEGDDEDEARWRPMEQRIMKARA
jgi:hypothetical protein